MLVVGLGQMIRWPLRWQVRCGLQTPPGLGGEELLNFYAGGEVTSDSAAGYAEC